MAIRRHRRNRRPFGRPRKATWATWAAAAGCACSHSRGPIVRAMRWRRGRAAAARPPLGPACGPQLPRGTASTRWLLRTATAAIGGRLPMATATTDRGARCRCTIALGTRGQRQQQHGHGEPHGQVSDDGPAATCWRVADVENGHAGLLQQIVSYRGQHRQTIQNSTGQCPSPVASRGRQLHVNRGSHNTPAEGQFHSSIVVRMCRLVNQAHRHRSWAPAIRAVRQGWRWAVGVRHAAATRAIVTDGCTAGGNGDS